MKKFDMQIYLVFIGCTTKFPQGKIFAVLRSQKSYNPVRFMCRQAQNIGRIQIYRIFFCAVRYEMCIFSISHSVPDGTL
jgi:hypothetical protein